MQSADTILNYTAKTDRRIAPIAYAFEFQTELWWLPSGG